MVTGVRAITARSPDANLARFSPCAPVFAHIAACGLGWPTPAATRNGPSRGPCGEQGFGYFASVNLPRSVFLNRDSPFLSTISRRIAL